MSKQTTCKQCDREFISVQYLKQHMSISHPKPVKPPKEPKVKKVKSKKKGNKWVKWVGPDFGGHWEMTKAYTKQLMLEGEDCAWDGLGNYLDMSNFESCAMDMATGDDRMTELGIPEYCTLRECVADAFHDGMLKGKARVIAAGRDIKMKVGFGY